jgi:hypothetical protein
MDPIFYHRSLLDVVSWQGNVKKYKTGPWNGLRFSGIPKMTSYMDLYSNQVIVGPDEVVYFFDTKGGAPISRLILNEIEVLHRLGQDPVNWVWISFTQMLKDICDNYAMCSVFGLCNMDTASTLFCSCVVGFSPVNPLQWSMRETHG